MSDDSRARVSDMLGQLEQRWVRLLSPYVDHLSYAAASFDSLVIRHMEAGRSYHTIERIERVVSLIEDLAAVPSSAPKDLPATELAGFFHDIVYDPRASDNEQQSAKLAGVWLDGLGVLPEVIEETQRLILLTAEHEASAGDRNAAALLDADLADLGAEPFVYDRYSNDLRNEHAWMSEADYATLRRKLLERILAREYIYRTPLCRSTLEPAARVNLRRELERLGPGERDQVPAANAAAPLREGASAGEVGVVAPLARSIGAIASVAAGTQRDVRGSQGWTFHADRNIPRVAAFPGHLRAVAVAVLVLLALIFVAVQMLRPLPSLEVRAVPTSLRVPGKATFVWPSQGQAEVQAEGLGSLGGIGADTSVPVASLTKIMTALVVLEDHPLAEGASGPSITVSESDVATYQTEVADHQSVVQVKAGEQLSELQALEAMLVGSGNNIAQMLATWDAGSTGAFVAEMNERARSLGLEQTSYVDPIGIEDADVSSASDEVRLAEAALKNPVFAQIVSEAQVTLPVAGSVYNFDYDLGHDGIVGVKTGSSTAAGGCFVFLARAPADGREVSVLGAVLGQQGQSPLTNALDVADSLVEEAFGTLKLTALVHRGQVLGRVVAPWGTSAPIEASRDVYMLAAPAMQAETRLYATSVGNGIRPDVGVGRFVIRLGSESTAVPAVASGDVRAPSLIWRLLNL